MSTSALHGVAKAAGYAVVLTVVCRAPATSFAEENLSHPRLYFHAEDLASLRAARSEPHRAAIWQNIVRSADWCAAQSPRKEWIATLADDPQYENLYDRFYGAMHDTAVLEHLAFASALSDPSDDPYFEAARAWTLAVAQVWGHEADNAPDAGKAYAVLRVMKALAVAYDVLYHRLSAEERAAAHQTLTRVGGAYYNFFQEPSTAGAGYNKHHGSVDAAPFGIMALALLGEVPEAADWLDLAIEKHVQYLLPHALTPSGTNDQSSNFWASTLQYRILFLDPLRRVTHRNLFAEFPDSLPGAIALAAVVGGQPRDLQFNEDNRSVLFGPSYGQINYWSPVMLYLARHHRQPLFQHLALWDQSLGALQHTRYITPRRGEELLFCFGPYAYLWYDATVPDAIEPAAPLSFRFPEPEVDETYIRASFEPRGLAIGMKKGGLMIHAGGRLVLADKLPVADVNNPAPPLAETRLTDDGQTATLECTGPVAALIGRQTVTMRRPGTLAIEREASGPLTWWYHGAPRREENVWIWPDGTRLELTAGAVTRVDAAGHVDAKKHYGGMEFADPYPFTYDTVTVAPQNGRIAIEVTAPHDTAPRLPSP